MKTRFLIAAVILFSGCPKVCDASSCAGCCDEAQECQLGTQLLTCGEGGARCGRCGAKEVCAEHGCALAPVQDGGTADAGALCLCQSGCCLPDGSCSPGNLNDACGLAMRFCATCAANERCGAGACTSAPCGGCLDTVAACQPGTALDACGADAGLCEACLADQSCVAGTCLSLTCTASTCGAGCCSGTTCVSPPTSAQCGLSGSACVACAGAMTCVEGACR